MTYPLNTAVKATEQGTNRDTTVTEKSGELGDHTRNNSSIDQINAVAGNNSESNTKAF